MKPETYREQNGCHNCALCIESQYSYDGGLFCAQRDKSIWELAEDLDQETFEATFQHCKVEPYGICDNYEKEGTWATK